MKKLTAITLAAIALTGCASKGSMYTLEGEVTAWNTKDEVIIITDHAGDEWVWLGTEACNLGDKVTLTMNDMGTYNYYDDEIVNIEFHQ